MSQFFIKAVFLKIVVFRYICGLDKLQVEQLRLSLLHAFQKSKKSTITAFINYLFTIAVFRRLLGIFGHPLRP